MSNLRTTFSESGAPARHSEGMAAFMALSEALEEFTMVWGDPLLASDLATQLGCRELEALTALLSASGREVSAEIWTAHHSRGDEPGDAHYPGTAA